MAGPLDFTGLNIEDSYQRVLQTDGTIITDGTGSFVNLQFSGSFSGSFTGTAATASYVQQAQSASYVAIGQGAGVTVSGMTVSANLRSVNGNLPDGNGNVAVSLAAVLTGTSASLATYATGGLAEGTVWIVSNDAAEKNGDSYVYDSGSVGVWYQIAPLDQTAADARYARINTATIQSLTSSFATTASYALSSSFASTASLHILDEGTLTTATPTSINFTGVGVTATNSGTSVTVNIPGGSGTTFPYDGTTTPAVITGSLIVSQSGIRVTGSLSTTRDITANLVTIGRGNNALLKNTAIGYLSLSTNPPNATDNTAVGYLALSNQSTGSTTITSNTAIGSEALRYTSYGTQNTAIGHWAGQSNTSGSANIAIGYFSFKGNTTGAGNTIIGTEAAYVATAHSNFVAIGYRAGASAPAMTQVVAIGNDALRNIPLSATGITSIVAIGQAAGQYLKQGNASTYIGSTTGQFAQGTNNTAIGSYALQGGTAPAALTSSGGGYNTAIGTNAMAAPIAAGGGQYNTAIGETAFAGAVSISGSYNTAIGRSAMYNGSKGSYNAVIGTFAGYYNASGSQNTIIGYNAGYVSPSSSFTTIIGTEASYYVTSTTNLVTIGYQTAYRQYRSQVPRVTQLNVRTVAIGTQAMYGLDTFNNTGTDNTVVGDSAMYSASVASYNAAIGGNVLYNNVSGSYNVSIGNESLYKQLRGDNNIAIGYQNLYNNVSGSNNVSIGYQALYGQANNTLEGNIALGYRAGYYTAQSSSGNVYIGPNAGPNVNTIEKSKLYIASGSGNPLIGGDFNNKTVTVSGSIYISGSIIPNVGATLTSSFELGSPTAAWNRIWVRSSSIHFVDDTGNELAKISADSAGAIVLPNIYTAGTFTAQTFVTQSTTTIVQVYHATGSNIFGSSSLDTHQFTGSMFVSGAMYVSDVQQGLGTNVITYSTGSGRLYYTSSTALIGPKGDTGTSAYESWLAVGNTGTESDFINSLQGAEGPTGPIGPTGPEGQPGATGPTGTPGANGIGFSLYEAGGLTVTDTVQFPYAVQFSGSVDSLYGYTGSLVGTSSWSQNSITASYIDPVYISASAASYGFGSGGGTTDISALNTFTGSIQTQVNSLTAATSSYVLNNVTSSMLAPYVLNSVTASMLSPYVLTASTSSMTVLSSSFALTASFVQTAQTASYYGGSVTSASFASTASFVNGLNQNVTITGSLEVQTGGQKSVSTTNRELYASNGVKTIDWTSQALYKSDTSQSLNWQQRRLYNSNEHVTVFWDAGTLNSGSTQNTSVDWFNRALHDSSTTSSVNWNSRVLYNSSGTNVSVDWNNDILSDLQTSSSVNWNERNLYDSTNTTSVDWSGRVLYTPDTTSGFNWSSDYQSTSGLYHQQTIRGDKSETLSSTVYDTAGQILRVTIDISSTQGELVYLHTDGIWYPVDQSTSTSTKMLGINIDGQSVLIEGDITLSSIDSPGYGLPVYIKTNGPTLSTTIPPSGYIRVLGHCYYENQTTAGQWILKFRPANDWYKI